MTERLFTTFEVARLIQMDPSSVVKWINAGKLLAFKTPGGHRRVREGDLRAFLHSFNLPIPNELGGKLRLLVADDDDRFLSTLSRAAKPYAQQLEITTTTSGVEAALMIAEQQPGAVLVDVNIPDLNGLELIRQVAHRKNLKGTRFIAMSGQYSPQLDAESQKAGAMRCLAKPIDIHQLATLLGIEQRVRA